MKLTILGCYAATPRALTNPTAQVLEMQGHLFLIDCGEGTQVQLRKNNIKLSRIKHIFISHLHGDHFFGLPGLISTLRLLGRDAELHIYGPKGIKQAITLLLKLSESWTNFPLLFHELESKTSEFILDDKKVSVHTIPLVHRIYTNGFLFKENPRPRTLKPEAAQAYGIDKSQYNRIKNGADGISNQGKTISNAALTTNPPRPKSYAFCSDTRYTETIIPFIQNVDVLYHESTFLETEARYCEITKHSTARQAATIAQKAEVHNLILGHYSTRYKSLTPFKEQASEIFPHVHLAEDGKSFEF